MNHRLTLSGCSPLPMAHYLKALGILRLVSEQADSSAAGCWHHDQFVLASSLDRDDLMNFFLARYTPTPIVAPWNKDSGFRSPDKGVLKAIGQSENDRFRNYAQVIQASIRNINCPQITNLPENRVKEQLLQLCRNNFPDFALKWLDAVYVITDQGAKFPPLLGTGGNDGRLEFSMKFMQRLGEIFDTNSGEPNSGQMQLLEHSLFNTLTPGTSSKGPVGLFFPGAVGGVNNSSGFEGDPAVNQWDYVLMMEGVLLFAAASVKRLEDRASGRLAFPFCVQPTSAGYASAAGNDEASARRETEMWVPLWKEYTTIEELASVFGEGRAEIGRRAARTGVDFARATVTVGVDRGLSSFIRYGILNSNGKSFFATPLARIEVRNHPRVNLLSGIDPWLIRFRDKANPGTGSAPASVTGALRHLEFRILDFCRDGARAQLLEVLVALGQCERSLANSLKWSMKEGIRPLSGTLSIDWLEETRADTPEYRLSLSLASLSAKFDRWFDFARFLEPLKPGKGAGFRWHDEHDADVKWNQSSLVRNLNGILARLLIKTQQSRSRLFPSILSARCGLNDIVDFIDNKVSDERIEELVWGLSLINFNRKTDLTERIGYCTKLPPAIYSLMKLCYLPCQDQQSNQMEIPVHPEIHRQAFLGTDSERASELASRRLLGSGRPTRIKCVSAPDELTSRTAAALLFPIQSRDIKVIREHVLLPVEEHMPELLTE